MGTTQDMKNLRYFLHITARAKHYNKRPDSQKNSAILLEKNNTKEYKLEIICDSKVYIKKLENNYLLDLYYLVF